VTIKQKLKFKPIKLLSLLLKIFFASFAIYLISFLYLIIAISIEPRSIDLISKKVNNIIKEFDADIKVKETLLKVDNFSHLTIKITNFSKNKENKSQLKDIKIDEVKLKISLIDLFFLNFKKHQIMVNNAIIKIAQDNNKNFNNKKITTNKIVDNFLQKVLNSNIAKTNILVNNVKINFSQESDIDENIHIKKTQIFLVNNRNKFHIVTSNDIKINNSKVGIKFNLNCNAGKETGMNINCNIFANNFNSSDVNKITNKFLWLDKIDGIFDIKLSFKYVDHKIKDLNFTITADNGIFNFHNFFSDAIKYHNLSAIGNISFADNIINISEIKANIKNAQEQNIDSKILMSLKIKDFLNDKKLFNYNINLYNIANDELDKYWPISLPRQDIRKWVLEKLDSGIIDVAKAQFTIKSSDKKFKLESINSEIKFSDINLNYHNYFPKIKEIFAIARFDKKSMTIDINSAKVLDSKILDSKVEIKNFFAKENILKISSRVMGPPKDLLRHIDYNSNFFDKADQYINGTSISNVKIDLPLKKNIALKDVLIDINSDIEDIENKYLAGKSKLSCIKKVNNTKFSTSVNLDDLKLSIAALSIEKEPKIKSRLKFIIKSDNDKLLINDINLSKIVDLTAFGGNKEESKISGKIEIDQKLKEISSLIFDNHNFGKNNFTFSYNKINNIKSYNLSGVNLDLSKLLNNKMPFNFADKQKSKQKSDSKFSLNVSKAYLSNNKILNNFLIDLSCNNNFCISGKIKANYKNSKYLDIDISKKDNKKYADINGVIYDIGYLAKAINISDMLEKGDVKFSGKIELVNDKNKISAKLKNLSELIFYENEKFKYLTHQDNLFLKIRDAIFTKGRTKFDNIDAEFEIYDNNFIVKSFVANNFKIGITAKGKINLQKKSYDIKGMIIPGYMINNLFGIAKIPVVGSVVSGVLTGGDDGGGIFGIQYKYNKKSKYHKEKFTTEKIKSFIPSSINNLFELLDG
jgi:hypothetical protein